jgi:hypothetical protein
MSPHLGCRQPRCGSYRVRACKRESIACAPDPVVARAVPHFHFGSTISEAHGVTAGCCGCGSAGSLGESSGRRPRRRRAHAREGGVGAGEAHCLAQAKDTAENVGRRRGGSVFRWRRCNATFRRRRCNATFRQRRCNATFRRRRCTATFRWRRCATPSRRHCGAAVCRWRCGAAVCRWLCGAAVCRRRRGTASCWHVSVDAIQCRAVR